ncbi:group I intron-associated PD-(D/E)XK endonuclease [Alkalihalobacillus sp. LMS6]|jgi:hypothetical protein|uniref:group I intron-associated PD-(D/E)XK endonuclease n=1 Tax=Alkalihalobacillus sp. LMS6 TaxID=2924034 RepID=UPI0020D1866A|nr:group I intron-associated PD-(D/E)XK endonuclease [Alkalihalobacillus sp. LMS6]UTR05188.1 group I intron-associated PD-(D/E)XK endonuclease [Alkalihalobacillus sp. LMS6]
MAHSTQVVGKVSEMTAARALLNLGWEVAQPLCAEVYDLVAKDPVSGEWATVQVKTLHIRPDRRNALVVFARKGNGTAYSESDCDYIIGVRDETVYMFENRGLQEYWSTEASVAKRWVKLNVVGEETTKTEAV